jgi:hypothetical protein
VVVVLVVVVLVVVVLAVVVPADALFQCAWCDRQVDSAVYELW